MSASSSNQKPGSPGKGHFFQMLSNIYGMAINIVLGFVDLATESKRDKDGVIWRILVQWHMRTPNPKIFGLCAILAIGYVVHSHYDHNNKDAG